MKRFLFLILCCICGTCVAQGDFINKWEQQALSRGSRWNYETQRATAAYNYTYTSLYVNGRFVASFSDAGTCRSKITELKQLAEQMQNQNTPTQPKQNSGEINLNKPATQELLRAAGVSEQEMKRQLQSVDNGLNNAYNAMQNQKKQDQLNKIDGLCSCLTEQNPNYDPKASMYSGNNDLFDFPNNEGNDGTGQFNILFDESTQYDNILDVLDTPNPRGFTTQTYQPVTLNFDDMNKYGNSQTAIYTDPHNLAVNRQIQQQPDLPEMVNTIDAEKEERERIAATIESLNIEKEKWEREWEEIAKECSKSKNEFFCVNQLKSISEKIEALTIQIAKTEWLQSLANLSPNELQQQKEYYQNLYNMALFANHSYGNDTPLPNGFKKPDNDNLNNLVEDYNTSKSWAGFSCEVFQNEEGKYIVAFRGTDPPEWDIKQLKETAKDFFVADILETLVHVSQTKAALNLIEDLMYKYEISADNITVTGHSLGGRLAAETAIKHGLTAYTFNAADISVSTKASNYINPKTNITNTVSSNDWVTGTVGLGGYFGGNVSDNKILKEANGGHSMADLANNISERLTDIYHFLYQNK